MSSIQRLSLSPDQKCCWLSIHWYQTIIRRNAVSPEKDRLWTKESVSMTHIWMSLCSSWEVSWKCCFLEKDHALAPGHHSGVNLGRDRRQCGGCGGNTSISLHTLLPLHVRKCSEENNVPNATWHGSRASFKTLRSIKKTLTPKEPGQTYWSLI